MKPVLPGAKGFRLWGTKQDKVGVDEEGPTGVGVEGANYILVIDLSGFIIIVY